MGILQEQLNKNENKNKLLLIKNEFLKIGIKFPKDEILEVMPRKNTKEGIIWFEALRAYWNFRNTRHEDYYRYCKKALDNTKQKLNKQ